jgi:hypothetical protein
MDFSCGSGRISKQSSRSVSRGPMMHGINPTISYCQNILKILNSPEALENYYISTQQLNGLLREDTEVKGQSPLSIHGEMVSGTSHT